MVSLRMMKTWYLFVTRRCNQVSLISMKRTKTSVTLNLEGVLSFLLAEDAVKLFTGSGRVSSGHL